MKIFIRPKSKVSGRKNAVTSAVAIALAALVATGTAHTPAVAITVVAGPDSKFATALPGQPSSKIVGGTSVSISTAPWQVAIIHRGARSNFDGQFCGGSLISREWIVTAAHCLKDGSTETQPSSIGIQVGNATLSTSRLSVLSVSAIEVHQDYGSSGSSHDIALIKLSSPVALSNSVAPLTIYRGAVANNTLALVTGWGQTGVTDNSGYVYTPKWPTALQGTNVFVADDNCWNQGVPGFNETTMLCAGTDGWMNDTCQGDSGGPLAINVSGTNYLAGVTSWGYGCAWLSPGIYTKVSNYAGWIDSFVGAPPVEFRSSPSPTISGHAVVGQTLSASTGDWDPSPSFTYQWFAGSAPISRATGANYTVSRSDLNKAISVTVTATSPGYISAIRNSSVTSSVLATMPFSSTGTPTVSGIPIVGQTLSASTGFWAPTPRFSYQWLANNSAIPRATGANYVLTLSDVGKTISVRITATQSGFTTTAATSIATSSVTAGLPFTSSPIPTIYGAGAVGQTLTANPGSWAPEPTLNYQWLSNGRAISRATGSTFAVTSSYQGRSITVQITAYLAGYASTTRTSNPVVIPRR